LLADCAPTPLKIVVGRDVALVLQEIKSLEEEKLILVKQIEVPKQCHLGSCAFRNKTKWACYIYELSERQERLAARLRPRDTLK
jgi:hypothetical protein